MHADMVVRCGWLLASVNISYAGGANIIERRYRYTKDLLALERASGDAPPTSLPAAEQSLPLHEWSPYLDAHPDQVFASFIRRGLVQGFRIGFDRDSCVLRPPRGYFESVIGNPATVSRYITSRRRSLRGEWRSLTHP